MKRLRRLQALTAGLALCLLAAGAWAGAADDFQDGNLAAGRGDYPTAARFYSRAIASGELSGRNLAAAHYSRGSAWLSCGQPEQARADFTRVIEIVPSDAEAYLGRGRARHDLGDPAGAVEDFDRAAELAPRDPAAYANRGRARYDLGDDAGAIEDFDRALEIRPGDATVLYNRGLAWTSRGDPHLALADAREALRLDPANPVYRARVKKLERMVLKKR